MSQTREHKQEFAVHILKTHLVKGCLASTYLLTGHPTAGETIALDFAKALLCERDKAFESCSCASCQKIERRNHPDVWWLGKDTEARSIKIEEVREMMKWASLKPYEGRWKVFLLRDAERLTIEAQNAVLKMLEEPPARTIFCLVAEDKARLLPTLSSRSFEIRLSPPEERGPGEKEEAFAGIGQKNWEDLLDPLQSAPREEVKDLLDCLMKYFRGQYKQQSIGANRRVRPSHEDEGQTHRSAPTSLLEAFDAVCETKDALEANANQKLALTRLTMQLKKIVGAVREPPLLLRH